ncbi:hypothetical protein WMY93_013773 [Mugilogobius chulae]|uniref:Meiosis regulator and mRNA stability factor 1 n=1 Tax=Mugilogobius chulae TaxID=88201 RepID=A0AAW0PA83_9GOBI
MTSVFVATPLRQSADYKKNRSAVDNRGRRTVRRGKCEDTSMREKRAVLPPPNTEKEGSCMADRKPVLDLKDVPAPLPDNSSPQSSQCFSRVPLPIPLPTHLPSPPQIPSQPTLPPLPMSQQKQGSSPKVSLCSHCEFCGSGGYNTLGGGAGASSSSDMDGVLSFLMSSTSLGVPSPNGKVYSSGPCSSTSSVQYKNKISGGSHNESIAPLSSHHYTAQLPSSVATSQPLSSHLFASGCSELLHPYPSLPLSCSQSKQFFSSAPPISSLPSTCEPLHGSCLASSGYYPCGVDCNPLTRRAQRSTTLGEHTSTSISTTTTSSHFCSMPMHPNVERTVGLKGAQHCQECMLKTASFPICNGCSSSAGGQMGQKYGSPERGGPENIPPVGVFWDIENCSVPSGRSAAAVVGRIRNRFFQGHREAEFICVCDISKECKSVIQELNNCQVTVAHINATAKNAADDKLRQSLRRFAETHTAPATVVLISSDVNFASELSDLRHRHGFQVILIHNHASPALLQHANYHVAFHNITADLPPRMINEKPTFSLLYVHNLPIAQDKNQLNAVKLRLRRLSANCGGKVLGVSYGTGVLRFASPAAAARACKRMEREDVFGRPIRVSFSPWPKEAPRPDPNFQAYLQQVLQALPRPFPTHNPMSAPHFSSLPFLPLEKVRSPRRQRFRATRPVPERPYSPRRGCSGPPHGASFSALQEVSCADSNSSDFPDKGPRAASSPRRNESGTLSQIPKPIHAGESMYRKSRDTGSSSPRRTSEFPVEGERPIGEFQISTPSAFSKLNLQRSFSPLVLSQRSWSSRSASPCLSSRSSPLLALPCSPCPESSPEPFSEGAAVQAANLDYRMSRQDLQQTLHDTFSRYGQVKSVELSPHTDYQLKATVQMVLLQDAISAVSGLHRYKIGSKRIQVSLVTGGSNKSLALLSNEILSILQDAPANCLPLFKFTEIYEKKFSRKLMVGDLYRLPDLVSMREQGGSRLVCLLHNSQIRQSPLGSSQSQEGSSSASASPVVFEELEYHEPICRQHYAQQDFSETDFDSDSYKIPFVVVSVKTLTSDIHTLLHSHEGTLPLLSKFIPSYHHHFAKQCRVSDYGYSKLLELLEAVPHVLQILGMGTKRLLTLTHRAQVKRFTQDLLKLLKFQASKQVAIKDFMQAYHWCFSKDWQVIDYGVCDLMDLLNEIPDTTIAISHQDPDTVICVPKRERTSDELDRTKQFGKEVVDLLRHQPHCRMLFSKFIPTYHHHFGRQCKLSYYGFTKLIELFEAIPDILMVLEYGEEKVLTLTEVERIKALLHSWSNCSGHKRTPVVDGSEGREVQLINRKSLRLLTSQILALLMSQEEEQVSQGLRVDEVSSQYMSMYAASLNPCEYGFLSLGELLKSLPYLVELYSEEDEDSSSIHERVRLTRLYQFARNVRALLQTYHYNQIFLTEFPGAYHKFTGCSLDPRSFGYNNIDELLNAIPQVVWIKGHSHKRIIVLKNDMKGRVSNSNSPQPSDYTESPRESPVSSVISDSHSSGGAELLSPVDLLCGPVPSCLPSPQLHPDPVLQLDLIHFEGKLPTNESSEAAAAERASDPEQEKTEDTKVSPQQPSSKVPNSPRRVSRTRFKLAANFTYTTGL